MFSLHIAWDRAGGVPGRQGVTKKAEQIARREKSCEFRNLQVLSCQRVLGVQQRHCFCLQIFKIYNEQPYLKKTAVCSIYFAISFTTPVYSKLPATTHPCYIKSHHSFLPIMKDGNSWRRGRCWHTGMDGKTLPLLPGNLGTRWEQKQEDAGCRKVDLKVQILFCVTAVSPLASVQTVRALFQDKTRMWCLKLRVCTRWGSVSGPFRVRVQVSELGGWFIHCGPNVSEYLWSLSSQQNHWLGSWLNKVCRPAGLVASPN